MNQFTHTKIKINRAKPVSLIIVKAETQKETTNEKIKDEIQTEVCEQIKEETKENHKRKFFKKIQINMPVQKIILTNEEKIELSNINKKIDDLKKIEQSKMKSLLDENVEQQQQQQENQLFQNIGNEIRSLEYERSCIYFVAERRMYVQCSNDHKEQKKKIKNHPNQKKIDTARALTEYLNTIRNQTNHDEENIRSDENSSNHNDHNENNENNNNDDDDDEFSMMIQNVRNVQNKRNAKRNSKTKKSSNLSFSLETIQQFVTLGLNPPSSINDFHQTITQLNHIISTFEAEPLVSLYDLHP
jgi:hypothetical protein